jgi:hypothetical protein
MSLSDLLVFGAYVVLALLDRWIPTHALRTPLALWVLLAVPGWSLLGFLPKLSRSERFALTVPTSFIISAVYAAVAYRILGNQLFTVTWSTTALLLLFVIVRGAARFTPSFSILSNWRESLRRHQLLLVGFGIYLLVHLVNFAIYPFLSEADGYPLASTIRATLGGVGSLSSYRPLFSAFTAFLSSSSGISVSLVFKAVFPLLLGAGLVFPYLVGRSLKLQKWALLLATILPLSASVIVLESDYTRPQATIILLFPTVLWLLISFVKTSRLTYWYLALTFSLVSLSFHEFGIFLLIPTLLCGIPLLKCAWHSSRIKTFLWIVLVTLTGYSLLKDSSLATVTKDFANQIWNSLRDITVHWWFISSYQNRDGNNLGWPGWTALLYYGYNLGLIVPFLLLSYWKKKTSKEAKPVITVASFALILPLAFAEVLPRTGIFYLPDRAWLYVSIALCFLAIPAIQFLTSKFWQVVAALLVVTSLTMPPLVTQMKQGWIDRPTYKAMTWIKEHTPPKSLVITQGSSIEPLRLYGERDGIFTPDLFMSHGQDEPLVIEATIGAPFRVAGTEDPANLEAELSTDLTALTQAASDQDRAQALKKFNDTAAAYLESKSASGPFLDAPLRPIYVMYSDSKFNGLYTSRQWWRDLNAAGADLSQFSEPHFTRMYDSEGTKIWQFQP